MEDTELKRAIVVVFDGLGIGELPDAADYDDRGSDTLDNTARAVGGLDIPNLAQMGLGLIEGVDYVDKADAPLASYGRMREASPGKDTATGHWEMMGIILDRPFPTYPNGFTPEIMERFEKTTGYGYLWGKTGEGISMMDIFGEEHIKTGRLIVYTSADSVFQIAAHEDVVPYKELYRVCGITRRLLYEYNIGRVISRPFIGRPGAFKRTERRRDYPVPPPGHTVLEKVIAKGLDVVGIGKIGDIFAHRGISEEIHTASNAEGMRETIAALDSTKNGVIFTNLVDLDSLYGHRNDADGYADALTIADSMIPLLTDAMGESDMLIITGDHGCDPTTPSTDHSREYVPLIVYGKGMRRGVDLGTRTTFADIGQTIAEFFRLEPMLNGRSFLRSISAKPRK